MVTYKICRTTKELVREEAYKGRNNEKSNIKCIKCVILCKILKIMKIEKNEKGIDNDDERHKVVIGEQERASCCDLPVDRIEERLRFVYRNTVGSHTRTKKYKAYN